MTNWIVKTALGAEHFLARIVPECDPSNTDDSALPDCNLDQLLLMGQNIVYFLTTAAFIITAFFIVIGAFKMIVSGGNEKILTSAKDNIRSAIYGLIIVLVSWVVLNSIITAFKSDACTGDWWKFGNNGLKCGEFIGEDGDAEEVVGVYCKAKPGATVFCRNLPSQFLCIGGVPGIISLNQYCQWSSGSGTCANKGSEVNLCTKVNCGAIEISDVTSARQCAEFPVNLCCRVPEVGSATESSPLSTTLNADELGSGELEDDDPFSSLDDDLDLDF